MKQLSLWLALALAAAFVSVLVAPQMTILAVTLAAETPPLAQQLAGLGAQELGLWGSALAVVVVGRRLGWRPGRPEQVGLLLAPIACEAIVGLLLSALPAAYMSAAGVVIRLCTGAAAIAAVFRLRS